MATVPRVRNRLVRLTVALFLFSSVMFASGRSCAIPVALRQAVGCLLTVRAIRENISSHGLRLGSSVWVRYYVGSVHGIERTPGLYHIMIYAPDKRNAWIFSGYFSHKGNFVTTSFDTDVLRRVRGRWKVREGFGGFHDYEAMQRFANWLEGHCPRYRVVLKPRRAGCGPAE